MNQIVLIALRRPYTFVVMSILIVLLGTMTVLHMPTDVFPNITIPVTSVVWIYAGLLPQQVEGRITYLFERFLTSTVEGIKYIHSHSYFGSSITNIFLQDGVDVARAEADIVGIAQNVVKALPPDISPPMVMRLAPSSIPVAMLQISSDTHHAGGALQSRLHANPSPARDGTTGRSCRTPTAARTCRSWSTSISRNCSPGI